MTKMICFSNSTTNFTSVSQNLAINTHKEPTLVKKSLCKVPVSRTFNSPTCLKNTDSQNPNGKTAPQIGSKKLKKLKNALWPRIPSQVCCGALSHGKIHVYQKYVIHLFHFPLFCEAHQNNYEKQLRFGLIWIL
jgi:hypothetical protein